MNEFLTAHLSCRTVQQNIFEKNSYRTTSLRILWTPFAYKLVNYSRHSESLNLIYHSAQFSAIDALFFSPLLTIVNCNIGHVAEVFHV